MHALRLGHRHLHRRGCSRATRQCRNTLRSLSSRPVEQTDIVCVLELGRRHVTQGWAANALAGDVVQPEDFVFPNCTLINIVFILFSFKISLFSHSTTNSKLSPFDNRTEKSTFSRLLEGRLLLLSSIISFALLSE